MKIALFPNLQKKQSKSLALSICEFLSHHGVTVIAEDDEAKEIGATPLSQIALNDVNFLISLGGDGSILRLVHHYYTKVEAPILGINLGHLGFMADVPIDDIYPSLQDLIKGAYRIEERLMLDGTFINGDQIFSVNDIVIHRAGNPSLIELAVHKNGHYVSTFEADGLIIATPTGSTAYSLAAGGPILNPLLDALVITPICAHTISNRPLVLIPDEEIQIQYISDHNPVEVRSDGITLHTLKTGDAISITRSAKKFRLVNLNRRDYFSTLRTKLGWAGKLR
jgi:NAD+ kinase